MFAQVWFNYNIDYMFNLSSFLTSQGWEGGIWLATKQTATLLACAFVGLCDLVRLHWECDWTQRSRGGVDLVWGRKESVDFIRPTELIL